MAGMLVDLSHVSTHHGGRDPRVSRAGVLLHSPARASATRAQRPDSILKNVRTNGGWVWMYVIHSGRPVPGGRRERQLPAIALSFARGVGSGCLSLWAVSARTGSSGSPGRHLGAACCCYAARTSVPAAGRMWWRLKAFWSVSSEKTGGENDQEGFETAGSGVRAAKAQRVRSPDIVSTPRLRGSQHTRAVEPRRPCECA